MRGLPKFFVRPDSVREGRIVLPPEEAAHISRVLRLRKGDEITVCDGPCNDYRCAIAELSPERVLCEILSSARCESEPSLFVALYMGLPKADKLEWVIQKAVELGVSRITPVEMVRCVAREKSGEKKLQRRRQLALAAAKQSGRGIVPEVTESIPLAEAADRMGEDELSFLLYERAGKNAGLPELRGVRSLSFLVGPEGGVAPEEAELLRAKGVRPIGLGERILRCETSPITFLSILMYLSGNF